MNDYILEVIEDQEFFEKLPSPCWVFIAFLSWSYGMGGLFLPCAISRYVVVYLRSYILVAPMCSPNYSIIAVFITSQISSSVFLYATSYSENFCKFYLVALHEQQHPPTL